MRLLHLDSSIQGASSASRAISATIADQLRSAVPNLGLVYRDLTTAPLPHLTLDAVGSPQSTEILEEFLAADIIVIGTPLYNFTIPGQLKAWIDRILVVNQTFRYTESGPEGLAGDKRVIVALARGGVYSAGSPFAPFEHAETLLRGVLAFIGISQPEFIIAEGLALGDEARQASIAQALDQAGRIASAR
jgi:FMN-dependent NADH-azoreductase